MDYEAFRAEYTRTYFRMMSYSPREIGAGIYAEKMAALADAHPEWAERAENEPETGIAA